MTEYTKDYILIFMLVILAFLIGIWINNELTFQDCLKEGVHYYGKHIIICEANK